MHIQQWFWEQWTDSALISENDLRNAEQKWALRTDFLANHDDTSSAEPHAAKSMYALSEEDLFKPTITGENQIRMASRAMEAMFRKLEPNADKTMIRVPAFVSSILWTYYGRPIATAIEDRQYFQIPAHVWERALESRQPKYNEAKIQRFLSFLSTHAEASPAIRFWAKQYIEAGCPGAP